MASVTASGVGTDTGIERVVGIVDGIIKTFEDTNNLLHASKSVPDDMGRILDICENVKKLLNDDKAFAFPKSILDAVERTLTVVHDIAEKYKNRTRGGRRIRHMPKALDKLNEPDKVEKQVQTVLALIAAIVAGEGEAFANSERTVAILGEQQDTLAQVIVSIDTMSTRMEAAVSDVEKICGPLADHALDDKVEEILQRLDSMDERVQCRDSNMNAMLPPMESIEEETGDATSQLPVPAVTTRQDIWVCNFSSVPERPLYAVETQYVRNLYSALLDETRRYRLVTGHGWGGAGKTTACKMIANSTNARQRFKDGIFWIEPGEAASPSVLFERLMRAVKESGGVKTSESIMRHVDTDKFELAKVEFHNWFDKRDVLFVLDDFWTSKDHDYNRWVDVLREIPGTKTSLLVSSRRQLDEKNVEFTQLNTNEETTMFLKHLRLQKESSEYQDNVEFAQAIMKVCAGLPLALAMAAGYLRRDPSGWRSLSDRIRKEITLEGKPVFRISQHAGLASVFQTSIQWLDREVAPPQNCSSSWAELYASFCVMDRASAGLPLHVLSLMWGISAEAVQEVCETFASMSLATLSACPVQGLVVKLHDLQLQYCVQQCARDRTPSFNSARSLVPEPMWHKRIIEGLMAKPVRAVVTDGPTVVGSLTSLTFLQAGTTATADAVVEAFMGLAENSVLKQYFLKNLGRHVCGYEEGLLVLARGVLSDYRLLLYIASRQPLSIVASQYCVVVNRMREWSENREGSKRDDVGTEFGRGFIRDLEIIADVLRLYVPPTAVKVQDNGEEIPCPIHGNWSVGDPGLAQQLVGRLRVASNKYPSLVLEASGGNGGGVGGDDSGRRSLVDMLVASIKRCAAAPWLVPLNRGYFEADRQGHGLVIRGRAKCCISFALGNIQCVAFVGRELIRVCNLASGDLICELFDEGAERIMSLAVTDDGCGMKPGYESAAGVDNVFWLAAGYRNGSVRIWDLETERCITTLHPADGRHFSRFSSVSLAADGRRVVHLTKPVNLDEGGLHVWDLSPDRTQESYEYVHGCKSRFEFEIGSAELLCQNLNCNEELRNSRAVKRDAVRFERYQAAMKRRRLRGSDRKMYCRVANCKDRVLVVTVNGVTGDVAVWDALTSEVISEFRFTDSYAIQSVAAFQRENGRVSVVTGHTYGMVRMRMADSGELIGQWQASRECVIAVAIAVKAGKVMGAYSDEYSDGVLWIWSFGDDRRGTVQSSNSASADALLPRAHEALNVHKHSSWINSIAISGNGKFAASCAHEESFVLVWDTATGSVLRRLDINEEDRARPRDVAISSDGEWILCASSMGADDENAILSLWGPFNQEFAARFEPSVERRGRFCVTINTSQDRLHGAILCGCEEDGYETYEWVLSCWSYLDIASPTVGSEDVVSEFKLTQKGSRDLLTQRDGLYKLHVRNAALGGVSRCTCKATAVFDCNIRCVSAWTELTALHDAIASTPQKVAVGLDDGTVQFLELCLSNV